jgi:hypothetical protein
LRLGALLLFLFLVVKLAAKVVTERSLPISFQDRLVAVTILLRVQRGWGVLFFLIWLTFLLLALGLARLLIFISGVIRVLALLPVAAEIIVL